MSDKWWLVVAAERAAVAMEPSHLTLEMDSDDYSLDFKGNFTLMNCEQGSLLYIVQKVKQ